MPTKPRKPRSDSPVIEMKNLKNMQERLTPPEDMALDAQAVLIFHDLVESMPRDSWDKFRIRLLASMAKMMAHQEAVAVRLAEEGPVITNNRGTPISNPLQSALTQTMSTVQSMARTLGMAASQRGISETSTKAKKSAEKKAKAVLENKKDKSLLA